MNSKKAFLQPLDRIAIVCILLLCLLIGLLILQGDVVKPSVRNFSWENKKIGADEVSFSLTFSRPMDVKSVEENLEIEPPLAGKFSWAGRRMVYTLLTPPPYGTDYQVQLQQAKDKFATNAGSKKVIQPFIGKFTSRDRVIAYIGADAENQGQLVLYNLTQQQKQILTPKNLVITEFKPYPNREKILFTARSTSNDDLLSVKLYTVTTGVSTEENKKIAAPGKVQLVLDNKKYQILKFDLSADGNIIVVQRGHRKNPSDFGLWFMPATSNKSGKKAALKQLKSEPGGDFIITPDSKAVAVAQGQGAAILPLQTDASKPLDFLPQFGLVQAFSKNGTQAAMVKFNTDYTRDLFLVTNQGTQKQLVKTTGSIVNCQFDPASPTLYCLLTQLLPGELYQEQPYLVAINLKTGEQKPLMILPAGQRNVRMSISPDGLGLLFDQVKAQQTNNQSSSSSELITDDAQLINSSQLWLMPLSKTSTAIKPEQLPLAGLQPQWLP
ncbi:Ig-like domain-containing protein [Calothrix rhizosoleniae]|uniref:Ig-like domain-containing protein n=1 Tax=Calothrix rhizosoleniae TaxID=888997 RepID=UPI000B4A1CF0|nr:Ig-like domain-containing protein [Calothrix rhizosoleniae]